MDTRRNWCTLFGVNIFILILLCGMVLIVCGAALIVFLVAAKGAFTGPVDMADIGSMPIAFLIAGLEILYIGVPALVFTGAGCPDRKRILKLSRPRLPEMLLSACMAVSAFGVFLFLEMLTRVALHSTDIPIQSLDITISGGWALLLWAGVICLLPAFLEEFAFRGLILGVYEGHMRPVWAILLSSAVFGLLHMQFAFFYFFIGLGAILGWVAYRTRSIWPGILLHFAYNLLALTFSYLAGFPGFSSFAERLGVTALMEGTMHESLWIWGVAAAVSAIIFGLCLLAFNRITKRHTLPVVKRTPHPFVDWVPLVITLTVLILFGAVSLLSSFLLSSLT